MKEAELPCILHWRQNHFVVLYKIKRNRFYIAAPGSGLIQLSEADFSSNWIGDVEQGESIALLLSPTPQFYEQEDEKASTTWYLEIM